MALIEELQWLSLPSKQHIHGISDEVPLQKQILFLKGCMQEAQSLESLSTPKYRWKCLSDTHMLMLTAKVTFHCVVVHKP